VCGGVFGSGMIRPYAARAPAADAAAGVTVDVRGTVDLFDTSVPHELTLTFGDAAYRDMLQEYFATGEKKYIEADLVIDGTRIPSVGVRLKGNSTLNGLTWNGMVRTRQGVRQGGGPFGGFGGGVFGSSLKGEEPENLPWLISFDEFVAGRRYQGHSQIAVRPALGRSATLLNEALAIALVGESGEPGQRFTYGSFSVNGRTSGPRLIVEYLDEGYAERLGDGVLYKALASGGFDYKGEDQTRYTTDFKQVNAVGSADLQPVIDLIRWVNDASDEEFASGLADRLDVGSFARYVALQNLLLNFDDMSGPGRNYYLWYDRATRRFRVINWDLNLAFQGDPATGPHDSVRRGFGPWRPPDGQGNARTRPGEPPQGGNRTRRDPVGGGGGPRMGHPLKDRFLASRAFTAVYEEQYRALFAGLFRDGTAARLLDEIVAAYKRNAGADTATVDTEAASLRELLQARIRALASDQVVSGT
jgi:spore coat protein CotH